MPRPIPDNVADVTGFIWYLIPVPDDPVFVQAAWDAFSELGQPWNWGEEGRVADSDIAAQKWLDAIYEALRVRDMGFPDDILTYIDEIEAKLDTLIAKETCCDGEFIGSQITDPDGTVQIDESDTGQDIVWGEGTPPGGEATWPDATLERCLQAQNFSDNLYRWIGLSEALQEVGEVLSVALFVGAVTAALPALGITLVTGAVSIGGVYTLMNLLQTALDSSPDFSAAKAELQTASVKLAITCAIIQADTAAAAESAIDAALQSVAPNAYPMIRAFPLRFAMGSIFNLDGDAGGFSGPCIECPAISLYIGGLAGEGFYVWDGAQYNLHQFPSGALQTSSGTTLRVKGTAGNGDTRGRTSELSDGSTALERTVTVSFTGANGSSITYEFWDADDNLISNGTANDNSGTFPLTVPNTWRWRIIQAGLKIDGFPGYWLDLEID